MKFRFDGQQGESICSGLADLEIENRVTDGILKSGKDYVTKAIRIKKVKDGNLVPLNKYEVDSINNWLFKSNYKVLEIGRYVYYAIFFKENRWMKDVDKGYIDLKIRLKPYAYSSKIVNNITVVDNTYTYTDDNGAEISVYQGEKIFTINNKSNVEGLEIYPEICIKLKDDKANLVTIENLTLNNKMIISGLETKECIYINGENQYMISKMDETRDIYSKSNEVYLKLQQGINEIKISSNGFANVSICHQEVFDLGEEWLNE
ncbi:Phage tail protein [uncultured Clostridium sp.]|uniref:hypothetical protein n=1 Tax=uncultured Clostridium sp. TaxID=59620 RepID=UPI000821B8D2|nr:hypothetical protein [uncultured Clostridium sp.]SCJ00248.1 Phage tail protein [uncultured Clostridium sp.]